MTKNIDEAFDLFAKLAVQQNAMNQYLQNCRKKDREFIETMLSNTEYMMKGTKESIISFVKFEHED